MDDSDAGYDLCLPRRQTCWFFKYSRPGPLPLYSNYNVILKYIETHARGEKILSLVRGEF